jgi:hypothetical protein
MGKKGTSRGGKSQSHSKSQSAKSLKRNLSKKSTISKGSRGRPKKFETDLLSKFQRGEDKTLKAEVLWNCIIRRMLRKIEKRLKGNDGRDKKLKDINVFIDEVNTLIDLDSAEIAEFKAKWENELGRSQQNKNRQFNQKEIWRLLQSSRLREIYCAFVRGLLSGSNVVKQEVLNLRSWPEDGDEAMYMILMPDNIQVYEETKHEPAEDCEMAYSLGFMQIDEGQDEFPMDRYSEQLELRPEADQTSPFVEVYADSDCAEVHSGSDCGEVSVLEEYEAEVDGYLD